MASIVFDVCGRVPYNRGVLMHILMIAPEPFFEPRGTPFSEYHRIRALLDLGHTVDLVTYPFGKNVELPGLTIFRAARPPFVTRVKIGPSPAKLFLDLALTMTALNRARRTRYDVIHSHEEGAAIGVLISAALGVPHLYDMHSSLPQQLENFAFSRSPVLRWFFQRLERTAIRRSRVTIVICPHLEEVARQVVPEARTVLIENAPGSGDTPVAGTGAEIRKSLGLSASTPIVLYTGTFEAYQGLDLLFAAAKVVHRDRPDVTFVLAGGKPDQVARAESQAAAMGVERIVFTGEQPSETIPSFLDAADVLVSPRSTGTNTPLKIYQYLRSGRVTVATRLLTHTQVLSDEVAILTEPTAEGFAQGILLAVNDRALARRLGEQARRLADTRYTYDAYLQRTREACAALIPQKTGRESFFHRAAPCHAEHFGGRIHARDGRSASGQRDGGAAGAGAYVENPCIGDVAEKFQQDPLLIRRQQLTDRPAKARRIEPGRHRRICVRRVRVMCTVIYVFRKKRVRPHLFRIAFVYGKWGQTPFRWRGTMTPGLCGISAAQASRVRCK